MARKVYVEVTARFDVDGKVTPLSLIWEDGTVFEIDKVLGLPPGRFVKGRRSRNAVHHSDRQAAKLSVL